MHQPALSLDPLCWRVLPAWVYRHGLLERCGLCEGVGPVVVDDDLAALELESVQAR